MRASILLAVFLIAFGGSASASDRDDYNRRAARDDATTFRQLDLDRNGQVTREEAKNDVYFMGRFNDMDLGRDGAVSVAEMRGYVAREYGVRPDSVGLM